MIDIIRATSTIASALHHGVKKMIPVETIEEAILLDRKLKSLWSQHPHFVFVPHDKSFIKKVNSGLAELAKLVEQHQKK